MGEHESNKKKLLFSCAMKGEWDKVIELYKDDARLHNARITRSEQTALHIAVSDGKENVVNQMLHVMSSQKHQLELVRTLRAHDHRGNTGLHLAASIGNATICRIIASVEATLVDDRNDDGETPLFLAALHGRKQAFLCLHGIRSPNITATPPPHLYVNCRRNNGDTILHCAINGDYFDLAFQIIHLYEDLANRVNEEGLSPLHLLASKPSAFKSGSRLGRIETIIYHCIYVEKLKAENPAHEHQTRPISVTDSNSHDCPDNYNILWNVFSLIRKVVTAVARKPDAELDTEDPKTGGSPVDGGRPNPLFPANFATCCNLIRFFYLVLMTVLGKGSEQLRNIYRKKETHTWSVQIVKELLHRAAFYEYLDNRGEPQEDEGFHSTTSFQDPSVKPGSTKVKDQDELLPERRSVETPTLMAAKNGVIEIIEKIVELFPMAIQDMNEEKKNIVLLAVEHRQPHVFEFLMEKNIYKESLFHQVDKDGNSALHLAATLSDYKPRLVPGEALHMQWEYKWYQFVQEAMPPDLFGRCNNKNETYDDVFTKTHKDLSEKASEWLNKTSESCSLVASVIATVAFSTAATVPGGVKQDTGLPTLEDRPEFQVFAIASLIALGFSITSMVMFLSVLISRFQEPDFDKNLRKLLVGLTSSVMSIVSMLVSFCAEHFFVLKDKLHYLALPIYLAAYLPITLFLLAQFPLYFNLLWATFTSVPQRSYRPTRLRR